MVVKSLQPARQGPSAGAGWQQRLAFFESWRVRLVARTPSEVILCGDGVEAELRKRWREPKRTLHVAVHSKRVLPAAQWRAKARRAHNTARRR